MESMEAIMTRLAKNEIFFGRYITLEEILAGVDRVSCGDILRLADRIFNREELTLTGLGPLEKAKIDWLS